MNRSFAIARPKRLGRCATRTLLLALPLSGIAFQIPPVQAQPATTLPAKKSPKPLSPQQKASIAQVLAISRQEKACKALIDLKVENATLQEVVSRVKQTLVDPSIAIETREAGPLRVGFDLKQTSVGGVLNHVAALSGCTLYVLSNGLLIAPESRLTEAELRELRFGQGGAWAKINASDGSGWSNRGRASYLFTRAIGQEVTGSDAEHLPVVVVNTTFGDFSPESQVLLREMAGWLNERASGPIPGATSVNLDASSPVIVDTSRPNAVTVTFPPGLSNLGGRNMAISDVVVRMSPKK